MADEVIARSFVELLPKAAQFGKQVVSAVKQQLGQATSAIDAAAKKSTQGTVKATQDAAKRSAKATVDGAKQSTKGIQGEAKKQQQSQKATADETIKQSNRSSKQVQQTATRTSVGVSRSFGNMRAGISKSFSGITGVVAGALGGIAVAGFLKSTITAASDLGETVSKTGVLFEDATPQVLEFAKTADKTFGQSQQQALDAAANFAIFGKSAGLTGTNLVNFSTDLVELTSDMASFSNTSPAEAIEAVGAALRGETEPIRRYGVLIDDASTRQEAMRLGIVKTTKEALTPQQRVLAVQSLIFRQTAAAQGDFARTSGGLANQQRILSAQFANFKASVGQVALPLVTRLFTFLNERGIPAIKGLADLLIKGDFTANFRKAFGVQEDSGTVTFILGIRDAVIDTAKAVNTTLIPALKSTVDWFRENKTLIETLAGVLGGLVFLTWAHEAALRAQTAGGFLTWVGTYLKQLQLVQGTLKVVTALQWAWNIAQKGGVIGLIVVAVVALVAALIYAYKHSEKFRAVMDAIGGAIATVAKAIWSGLVTAFHAVVDAVKAAWGGIVTAFDAIKGAIGAAIGFIKGVFSSIVSTVSTVVAAVGRVFATIGAVIMTPINVFIGVLKAVWPYIMPILVLPFYLARAAILGVWAQIKNAFALAVTFIKVVFAAGWSVVNAIIVKPLQIAWLAIKGIWKGITDAFSAAWTWVSTRFIAGWNLVKDKLSGPVKVAGALISGWWKGITGAFQAGWTWFSTKFMAGWNLVKEKLSGPVKVAVDLVKGFLTGSKNSLVSAFTSAVALVGKAWDGIKQVAKIPINFVVDTVINKGLIAGFNWIAGKLQAPTIPNIPWPPKGWASGGMFDGRLPGAPSMVDNLVGVSKGRTFGLAGGEFVVNAKQTAKHLPELMAMNSGREGYADGGVIGSLKKALFGSVGDPYGDVADFTKDAVGWFKDKFSGPLKKLDQIGNSTFAQTVKAVPKKIADTVYAKAKDLAGFGAVGPGGPNVPPGSAVAFRGVKLNQRTIQMVLAAEAILKKQFHITQGSYSTRVAASGSTHAGGGAMDTNNAGAGWPQAVSVLRSVGFAAWWRRPNQGPWNDHIHSIARGDPTASPAAKNQVADYLRGGDGLGGRAFGGLVPAYANGTWMVPRDQYAYLHRGEMVLPETIAGYLRRPVISKPTAHQAHLAHVAHVAHQAHLGLRSPSRDRLQGLIDRQRGATTGDYTVDDTSSNVQLVRLDDVTIAKLADAIAKRPVELDGTRVDRALGSKAVSGGRYRR